MEHNVRGCSRRPCCSMWVCVSLLWDYEHRSGTTRFHTARLPKKLTNRQQPDRRTQLDTDRHATATPLCGPTRYDLHLTDGTERKRRTRKKKRRAGQRGNEEDRRSSCLFALNWLVSPLCWILTGCACCYDPSACSPMARGGGTTQQARGRGAGEGWGALRDEGGPGGQGERAGADWGL